MKDKKLLVFGLGFAAFGVYTLVIAIMIPERFIRLGRYYTGLNGWEFGSLLLGIYLFIAYLFLVKNPRVSTITPQLSPEATPAEGRPHQFRKLVILNVLVSIAIFLFMFVTQVLEVLIKIYKGYPHESVGTTGFGILERLFYNPSDYDWTLYMIWTFCGVFFFVMFICFGLSVDLANRQRLFGFTKVSPWSFCFWANIIVGSTGLMYVAWFLLMDGDPAMWTALASGTTWGFFALGNWGVFFTTPVELIFMVAASTAAPFLNFATLHAYHKKFPMIN